MKSSINSPSTHLPSSVCKFIAIVSFSLLCHSAYSAFEHISYLKTMNRTNEPLPSDIVLETILATFLCLISVLLLTDPLKPISLASEFEHLPRAAFQFHPNFITFPSRVRFFSSFTEKIPSAMLNEPIDNVNKTETKKNV